MLSEPRAPGPKSHDTDQSRAGIGGVVAPAAALRAPGAEARVRPSVAAAGSGMGGFLAPIIEVVIVLLDLYWWVIIISAVASWLIAFGVINTYNRTVARIIDMLYRLTEPALRPIRQFLPNFGGVDISPIILLLVIWLIEQELRQLEYYVYRL